MACWTTSLIQQTPSASKPTCRPAKTVRSSTGGRACLGRQFADQSRDTARRTTFARVITAIQLQTDVPGRAPWWRGAVTGWMGTSVSLALAASLLFVVAIPREQAIQQELISGHVRSLLASHLTDVTTSDQHTVKPWFNGKLDASPPVVDLASQGFPLIGGRLDYIHNHVVGALVFKHDQHVINLFIWPVVDADDSGPASATREGFNLLHWTCSGMTFWAVSDVNPATLRRFQAEYDRQTNGSSQS